MFIGFLVAALLVGAVVASRYGWKPSFPTGNLGSNKVAWMTNPWVLAGVGILLVHLILGIGWPQGYVFVAGLRSFWVGHIAFAFFFFTATQSNTAVKSIRQVIVAVWAITAIAEMSVWTIGKWTAATGTTVATLTTPVTPGDPPVEVVLGPLARCESGGRQFDDQGNLVTNPTSTAIGMYGIMASLHEERAKSMGHNIRNREGNEAFAKILYAEEKFKPWEASRWCWEKDFLLLGYFTVDSLPTITKKLTVAKQEWDEAEEIRLPMYRTVTLLPESAVAYEVMTASGEVVSAEAINQGEIKVKSLFHPWFKVRAIDADSVVVNLVAYVPKRKS